ncbi:MAG: RIO kinase 1, partial [Burkholderiaceae bacterium]
LYKAGLLTPDTPLTGVVAAPVHEADVGAVIREIALAREEEEERQRRLAEAQS